jgi:pyrimidine oxygenase
LYVELGVFLPISNNGWIVSKTSPQYKPSFELNRAVTQKAESFGFEFVLSMARWRGYGGETEHWDHSLESISLMSGLAAVTERIELYATVHPTTINPYVAAKMIATFDDISGGRAGLNIASGWDRFELSSFGAWPGDEHYRERDESSAAAQTRYPTSHEEASGRAQPETPDRLDRKLGPATCRRNTASS